MPALVRAGFAAAALLLGGCSWLGLKPQHSAELLLLPPQEGPASVMLKQAVTLVSRRQSVQFIVASRFDHQSARLAALMPSGLQLASLEYDGEDLKQTVFVPMDLPGEQILATMQFSLWPEASLQHLYSPQAGWRLDIQPLRRQLWYQEELFLDVIYDRSRTEVVNYPQGYSVTIQTIEN